MGQLAVDLLLHNLRCRRVGAFSHPSLHAVVGNLPDSDNTGHTHLMTAMEGTATEGLGGLNWVCRYADWSTGGCKCVSWCACACVFRRDGVIVGQSDLSSRRPLQSIYRCYGWWNWTYPEILISQSTLLYPVTLFFKWLLSPQTPLVVFEISSGAESALLAG